MLTPSPHSPETKVWSTQIHVLPGTHHFKFIVDEQWRIAEDYPTAVDDLDGSLANYVNAASPTSASPASSSPRPGVFSQGHGHGHGHHQSQQAQFASFFSEDSSEARTEVGYGYGYGEDGEDDGDGGGGRRGRREAAWTTAIPQELVNAAQEEENYLACADSPTSASSVPAPNIPPAPVLPRHLDKLILNPHEEPHRGYRDGDRDGRDGGEARPRGRDGHGGGGARGRRERAAGAEPRGAAPPEHERDPERGVGGREYDAVSEEGAF
ncbi:hypothetical protein EIP86_008685 [Pleurotus ostreatoroseus]|nr:hypothetical protein EIP86_008685 [Pleurotus ostreatoroseus]